MTHHHHHQHTALGHHAELIFSLSCGFFLLLGFLLSTLFSYPFLITLSAYLCAYFFGSFFIIKEALENWQHKRIEVDTLMLAAAIGAAFLGSWAEGSLLLFLFSLGHSLEHFAMGKAKNAIEALTQLAPDIAHVYENNHIIDKSTHLVAIGDTVLVRPFERLPMDGFVVNGETQINQAPITGESLPQEKWAVTDRQFARQFPQHLANEHRVFAGSINGAQSIDIEVSKVSSESTLAKIAHLVSTADIRQSQSQQFAKQFERYFVPSILLFVFMLFFAFTVIDESFQDSFYRAMAVLVAASPCALAIATPSAVLSSIACAARVGILIKGGASLEIAANLQKMAFDKTGTLTTGKSTINAIIPHSTATVERLLDVVVAVETLSDHAIAQAIVTDGKKRLPTPPNEKAENLQNHIGLGISAYYKQQRVLIGKPELFTLFNHPLDEETLAHIKQLRTQGNTIFAVSFGAQTLGVIGVMDQPRTHAKAAIAALNSLGITETLMLSGDSDIVAKAVAKQVGIDHALGDLMPEDKVTIIQQHTASHTLAMVGDGVNDAPAMANASIGIAMGAASSAVALETADIALMSEDLRHLVFFIQLSRKTQKVIQQNLLISLGMVAILLPSTLFGLPIGAAVLFHEGSTLIVVLNALRLLNFKQTTMSDDSPI